MIQALLFDVGGVLVRTAERAGRAGWEARLGLSPGGTDQIVFDSEMGQRAQRGASSDEELWQWVRQRLALTADGLAAFRRDFWGGDTLDHELMALIRRLRPRYQTAIISNATDALRASLAATLAIADAFDLIVVSAEEGVMKPDPAIYRLALQRLGRRPEEAVFIDDNAANVAGARHVGMAAIRFNPALDLSAELRRLGVAVTG